MDRVSCLFESIRLEQVCLSLNQIPMVDPCPKPLLRLRLVCGAGGFLRACRMPAEDPARLSPPPSGPPEPDNTLARQTEAKKPSSRLAKENFEHKVARERCGAINDYPATAWNLAFWAGCGRRGRQQRVAGLVPQLSGTLNPKPLDGCRDLRG